MLLKRAIGLSKFHLDIVDYPGEWLIDLPLLEQDYRTFSTEALALAASPSRTEFAKPFLGFLAGTDPAAAEDEQIAITGAKLFTAYLRATSRQRRTIDPGARPFSASGRAGRLAAPDIFSDASDVRRTPAARIARGHDDPPFRKL